MIDLLPSSLTDDWHDLAANIYNAPLHTSYTLMNTLTRFWKPSSQHKHLPDEGTTIVSYFENSATAYFRISIRVGRRGLRRRRLNRLGAMTTKCLSFKAAAGTKHYESWPSSSPSAAD